MFEFVFFFVQLRFKIISNDHQKCFSHIQNMFRILILSLPLYHVNEPNCMACKLANTALICSIYANATMAVSVDCQKQEKRNEIMQMGFGQHKRVQ